MNLRSFHRRVVIALPKLDECSGMVALYQKSSGNLLQNRSGGKGKIVFCSIVDRLLGNSGVLT
jgi:hypothetical protein